MNPLSNDVTTSNLNGTLQSLALLLLPRLRLGSHDATTPVSLHLLVLVRVSFLDGRHQLRQVGFILGAHFGESDHGSSL